MKGGDSSTPEAKAPSRFARRTMLLVGVAALTGGAVAGAKWFNIFATNEGAALDPAQAMAAAQSGQVLLIDIRRPDEWSRTGVGQGAIPIDMRRDDFVEALLKQAGGDASRSIALICARGVRSSLLASRLSNSGFTQMIDVPEGMLGSGAGPGWLKRGLPVVSYE